MLNKIKDRPKWYAIWAISVAIAALYVLIRVFNVIFSGSDNANAGFIMFDHILLVYVHASILLEMYLYPKSEKEEKSKV